MKIIFSFLLLILLLAGCATQPSFAVTKVTVGSGTSGNNYETNFTNSDLSGGNFVVAHDLNSSNVGVQVYNNNDLLIEPDFVKVDSNSQITVTLSSFQPLTGTWSIIVLAATSADFAEVFDSSDINSGVLTLTHNLNNEKVAVFIYDSTGREISADEVEWLSANRVSADLNSFVPFVGSGRAVVFSGA